MGNGKNWELPLTRSPDELHLYEGNGSMWFDGNQSSRTRKLLQPRLPRCHCRS